MVVSAVGDTCVVAAMIIAAVVHAVVIAAVVVAVVVAAVQRAAVAMVGAVLLSPLFPFGVARRADPSPGLHLDWTALAVGAVVTAAIATGVATAASLRATGAAFAIEPGNSSRRATSIPWSSRCR